MIMARPHGRKNSDHLDTRTALIERVAARIREPDGPMVSFRDMASAADVSVPTLRHYFGDRVGLLRAVMEQYHRDGEPYLRSVAAAPLTPLDESVGGVLRYLASGLSAGLGRVLLVGFGNAGESPAVGRACVTELLEPILRAVEIRLERHIHVGDLEPIDVRLGAVTLVSPVVMALLHQHELDGESYRPLDVEALITFVANAFVRAHGRSGAEQRSPARTPARRR
jgi:AcrR family transcriptional regulator